MRNIHSFFIYLFIYLFIYFRGDRGRGRKGHQEGSRRATRNFSGRGGFLEWGHFDVSCVTHKRKAPQGKILVFFLQDALKSAF